MVEFIELPDVVLLLILSKLPVWMILQLARLCHRLNHLKQAYFNARLKHLRLFAGSNVNKFCFNHKKVDFFHLCDDFDLIIRFANQPILNGYSPFSNIALSEDLFIENVDQISRLALLLPRVTHLTVVILTKSPEMPDFCARLLSNWPKLKSLTILNQSPKCELMSQRIPPVINSLEHLEHLQIDIKMSPANPVTTFAPLLSRGKLKTLICSKPQYEYENNIINGKVIFSNIFDRTVWNYSNEMLQALEIGLYTFGLVKYKFQVKTHLNNRTLLRKFRSFQGNLELYDGMGNLVQFDLTDWTALQCVHLQVLDTNSTLKRLLDHLSVLTNLTELHLDFFSVRFQYSMRYTDDLLSSDTFHDLPRLESVRQLQVYGPLEPHECLPKLACAFPNATELSLRLWTILNTENNDFDSSFKRRGFMRKLCTECWESTKRAFDKYGHNIASFHMFLEHDHQGPTHNVVPKVKLFTKKIAGQIRPNFGYISIE